jgi:hypothetical protein
MASFRALPVDGNVAAFFANGGSENWRGYIRRYGEPADEGLSASLARGRADDPSKAGQWRRRSRYMRGDVRYGVALGPGDVAQLDASMLFARARPIGGGRLTRTQALYAGGSLIHEGWLEIGAGWYQLSNSGGRQGGPSRRGSMQRTEDGLQLALDWRIEQARATASPRIGIAFREGDAVRRRSFAPHDERVLLRFDTAF